MCRKPVGLLAVVLYSKSAVADDKKGDQSNKCSITETPK